MKKISHHTELKIDIRNLHAYSAGLLQGKAYSRMHVFLTRMLVPFNLSIPEWKLLGQVYDHNKVKLTVLAELLGYDPPMVTKLVKQMEKKEFLKRKQDPDDERAKFISVTPQGKELIEEVEPKAKMVMATILQGVSKPELHTYIKVLMAIVRNTH